jgi:hypothetical protein
MSFPAVTLVSPRPAQLGHLDELSGRLPAALPARHSCAEPESRADLSASECFTLVPLGLILRMGQGGFEPFARRCRRLVYS